MISVCMATYNGGKYVKEQIDSIINQLSNDDELIISDDGSKDETYAIVSSYKDDRIKWVNNTGKHGVVPNFENSLAVAKGDVIFFSDQDDIWADNKVKVCLEALKDSDLVVHNSEIIDAEGNLTGDNYFSIRNSGPGFWKNLYKNSFVGSCMAFKSTLIPHVYPFPKNILWHDMWVGLVAEKKGKTKFIEDVLLLYRRHGSNASPTGEKSKFSIFKQFSYRFYMIVNLLF